MEVFLVRHAKSSHNKKYKSDSERPLTKKGVKRQTQIIKNMLSYGMFYQKVWISPLKRSQQTFEIIQQFFSKDVPIEVKPELEPMNDPTTTLNLLKKEYVKDPDLHLLIVGHNPHLTSLLTMLVGENNTRYMKTSEAALVKWTNNGIKLIRFFSKKDQ